MLPNPFQGLYTVDDSGLIGAVTDEEPGIPFAEIEEYLNG